MYIRKSVGWRMESSGRPTLTGYSCENFPSRNTRSQLLLRKDKIRPNSQPEIPEVLSLWKRTVCEIFSKVAKRSAVEREDFKLYQNIKRKLYSSRRLTSQNISKDFNNHRKNANRAVGFSCRPLNILKYRNERWDLLTVWKQESFSLILKSSGFLFFKTIAGIQSGLEIFGKSELRMIFLTNLGVT